jgi:hypothetical protein
VRKKTIGKWGSWRLVDTTSVFGHQVEACQNKKGVYMILQLFDMKR